MIFPTTDGLFIQTSDRSEEALHRVLTRRRVANHGAQSKHHDAVGYLENVRQGVGNKQDTKSLFTGGLDDV